jgi:RNA polymerase-binding transcription factor DksA
MSELNGQKLQTLRAQLDQRESQLREEVRAAKEASAARSHPDGVEVEDGAEVGDERVRAGIEHVEMQRDQEELLDIEAARERMADGSYGECIDCLRVIPYERLHAQPTAARCIDCQTLWEKSHPATPRYAS